MKKITVEETVVERKQKKYDVIDNIDEYKKYISKSWKRPRTTDSDDDYEDLSDYKYKSKEFLAYTTDEWDYKVLNGEKYYCDPVFKVYITEEVYLAAKPICKDLYVINEDSFYFYKGPDISDDYYSSYIDYVHCVKAESIEKVVELAKKEFIDEERDRLQRKIKWLQSDIERLNSLDINSKVIRCYTFDHVGKQD